MSRAVAVSVSVRLHTLVGTMYWPPKLELCPGSSRAIVVTGVLLLGWLLTITMFVTGMLPTLVMKPVKARGWPGAGGVVGQILTIRSAGTMSAGHVAVALVVKLSPQTLRAVATSVSTHGPHWFTGTV